MISKNIAVAGGSGGIGRHIVEGLLELKHKYSLSIIVLSRKSKGAGADEARTIHFTSSSASIITVDYHDINSIELALRNNSIDTIISTLSGTEEAFVTAQQNLLEAALRVPTFRRFAPSEFAFDSERIGGLIELYRMKEPILGALRKAKLDRSTSHSEYGSEGEGEQRRPLEFTKFNCGLFMNYFAFGNPKPPKPPTPSTHNGDVDEGFGHLKHISHILDIKNKKADIPGDGEGKLRITRAQDVGRFVAGACTRIEEWSEESDMAGDEIKLNDLVRMAEKIVGTKIDIKYNSKEELLSRLDPNPSSPMTNFFSEIYLSYMERMDQEGPLNLNEQLEDIQPMKVEEFIRTWWGDDEQ